MARWPHSFTADSASGNTTAADSQLAACPLRRAPLSAGSAGHCLLTAGLTQGARSSILIIADSPHHPSLGVGQSTAGVPGDIRGERPPHLGDVTKSQIGTTVRIALGADDLSLAGAAASGQHERMDDSRIR